MTEKRIETDKSPLVEVTECLGDLVVRPWMEMAVKAIGDYQFEKSEGGLLFQATDDLILHVPEGTSLKIGTVAGDLVIKTINGNLSVEETKGDAVLSNIGSAKIKRVYSDLVANNLSGSLSVEKVFGDVQIRNVEGQISFDQVSGDISAHYVNGSLYISHVEGDINLRTINGDFELKEGRRDVNLRNLGGICSLEKVHGDIRLLGGLVSGTHHFNAEGDIVVRWPTRAPIELVATSSEIKNRLPLKDIKQLDDQLTGRLGQGETIVSFTAGGRILLKESEIINKKWGTGSGEAWDMDFWSDLANIGERVSAEVNNQMERMSNYLETRLGPEFAQNISEKVSKQADKAARQAEMAARKAQKYAERESARAERNYRSSTVGKTRPNSPKSDTTSSKASSEEQLKILKMVEKGTISPEEANILLEALGG